jgi:hypothetical protein
MWIGGAALWFYGRDWRRWLVILPASIGLLLLISGIQRHAEGWKATFSKEAGKLHAASLRFGTEKSYTEVPLDDIRYATLGSKAGGDGTRGGGSWQLHWLILVTRSGEPLLPLKTMYTDTRGLDRARDAINRFLGTTRPTSNRHKE